MTDPQALLRLLQLASPALPVGAFSYSEGLETLVDQASLRTPEAVRHWLTQELQQGSVRLEAAILVRSHQACQHQDTAALRYWNDWLSAARESEELRQQSWQMGRALTRLLEQLHPELRDILAAIGSPCNFAIAFGLTAAHWQIEASTSVLGYLQSWATNLVNAAVKLVPLGQTVGQQLLLDLGPTLVTTAATVVAGTATSGKAEVADPTAPEVGMEPLTHPDDLLISSGWGLSLASMQHETLYSRLFRS